MTVTLQMCPIYLEVLLENDETLEAKMIDLNAFEFREREKEILIED